LNRPDARQQILKLFHDHPGEFVSGARISETLGVSRTAVWKQISQLRLLGYRIEAVTSRGYRLEAGPDRLLAEELRARLDTALIGREIQCLDEIDSTNLRLMELAEQGAGEGLVLFADRQTAGKGRLGRRWESPGGVNLYLSVLLRPQIQPWHAPQLTFLSAVAVARAIEQVTGLQPRVKWPNDLLLAQCKVAGLLNEMSAETDAVHCVVLGIGINVNMRREQFPADLRYPATSLLLETGQNVSRLELAAALLQELDRLYSRFRHEGIAPLLDAWRTLCDLVGRRVRVSGAGPELQGLVTGIDDEGALLLELPDGGQERILAGDVSPLE